MNKWETLKCILRGSFIQHGSRLKKAYVADIKNLFALIATLEATHKRILEPKTLAELSHAHRDLLRLLTERSLAAPDKGRHLHYVQANKRGKHLAHPRQCRQNIPHIHAHPNRKLHKNSFQRSSRTVLAPYSLI